jgi:hypothetical protein
LVPSKRLAEKIFGEIAGWIVLSSGNATRAQLFRDFRMQNEQLLG